MSDTGKGKRGWPRRGRRAPPGNSAPHGRPPESDRPNGPEDHGGPENHGGPEDHGGGKRAWRRNQRRREPSTPDNSWLATQPEFQRYWGDPGEAEPEPQPPMDHQVPEPPVEQPPPQTPPKPRPRLRHKPADLSTLMARYTARAEEQESFALPRPSPRRSQPPPKPPAHAVAPQNSPPGPAAPSPAQAPRPAPARSKTADPKFVASPLPAEAPEAEPGRPTQIDPSRVAHPPAPAPASAAAPGSMIVSDGQVKIVDTETETAGNGSADDPHAGVQAQTPELPPDVSAPPQGPGAETPPAESGHQVTDTISQYLPSDDPDYASVSIRPAETPDPRQVPAPDLVDEHDIDWRDREPGTDFSGDKVSAPEPVYAPQEPDFPPPIPAPEPAYSPAHGPVRFDGPLPYQNHDHDHQGPNLADWDNANERLDFEPAWHARERGGGFGRKLLIVLIVLGIAGAGGYGLWSGKAGQLIGFASSFMPAPGTVPELNEEPVISRAPDVDPARPEPVAEASPLAAPSASTVPLAPSTVTLAPVSQTPASPVPEPSANPVDRVASDPNLITRQIEGPGAQTTTLWWQQKSVTRFPALTPAELAGQPKPPSAQGESVMAPSGPSPGANAAPGPGSPANAAEIARIDELIQSFAIQKADTAIAPLLASAPGDASLLLLSGRVALAKSSNLEALAIFDQALTADPASINARTARGRALVNLGRATEAQTIAAEVLAANPNDLGALWLSAEAQASTGALQAATDICGRLEAAGAEPGSGEWCRGVANKRARRPLQAETIFISALQSGSRDFVSMRQLYFRFKGYFNGKIDGVSSDDLLNAATRCASLRDCNTAGI